MTVEKKPEILAPVGTLEMAQAAVHNGADAIYVGLPGFNARGRTENFTLEALKEIIDFCHRYQVRVFIAANILIFEKELDVIRELLADVIALQPDAFIVQDIGLVRLIKAIAPDQIVHASTQMTITNAEAIALTADLNMQRYVLGRENSLDEIKKIRAATDKELEVFIHGALCVSYSGQCLTSESFGGRSANRGQCAQSCRLPYELIVDGKRFDDGTRPYVVSPQDLCGLDDVEALCEMGIDSFKIEGRLKSPAYVAESVKQYRRKIDGLSHETQGLSLAYSRGFFNGWLGGVSHQKLVDGRFSNHHGLQIGTVKAMHRTAVEITITAMSRFGVAAGDGLLFVDFLLPVAEQRPIGAFVYEVKQISPETAMVSFANDFQLSSLRPGMAVFQNKSVALDKETRQSFSDKQQSKTTPLLIEVFAAVDAPLQIKAHEAGSDPVCVQAAVPLEASKNGQVAFDKMKEEIGALSGTPFRVGQITVHHSGAPFIPNKIVKELRRQLVDTLLEQRRARHPLVTVHDVPTIPLTHLEAARSNQQHPATLSVLVRDKQQLTELAGLAIDTVYLDFEYGKEYHDAVSLVRSYGYKAAIATTRIFKPGELGHLKVIERIKPDAVLVRNIGALKVLADKGLTLRGDFSLNITNSYTADWFLGKGLATIAPSYDLNSTQLFDLLTAAPIASRWEIVLQQYMPGFHMEHCVFAAFLSQGSSWRDCGKPCEQHRVELKDPKGMLHPLKPDAECRNTMFNGKAQTAVRLLPELIARGVSTFRIEALFETPAELRKKLETYLAILKDGSLSTERMKTLAAHEQYGITEGQLFNINSYKDRKKSEGSNLASAR
jgi:putative protease